ncbi:MAG: hypothetical protein AAFX94_00735 [Myxococcota bacterium]
MLSPLLVAVALLVPSVPDREIRDGIPKSPELSISYENLSAIRYNPLGLVDFFYLSGRLRLHESDSLFLRQNYIGAGFAGGLSPAWVRLGGIVELKPVTVWRLWARYVFVQYFGTFNLLASFPDAEADFSDTAVENRADQPGTENQSVSGTELTLGSDFQLKAGPVALRNFTRGYRADMDLRDGDTTFYDQIYDVLMPNAGWVLTNETDLLYLTSSGWIIGGRYTFTKPFYEDRHRSSDDGPSNVIHRAGPLVAYQFSNNATGRFQSPTLLLLTQWHFEHRFRTGEDVSQAVPYVGLGFLFRGDLLTR